MRGWAKECVFPTERQLITDHTGRITGRITQAGSQDIEGRDMNERAGVRQEPRGKRVGRGMIYLILCLLAGCEWQPQTPSSPLPPLRPVRTEIVQTRAHEPIKRFVGAAEVASTFSLSFSTTGRLKTLQTRAGERVTPGEVLAVLDQQTLLSDLSQSRTSLARAEADFRNAESLLERVTVLRAENKSSQSDVDTVRASLERAHAARDSASSRVRFLEEQLAQTEIVAPDHCTVVRVLVTQGTPVRQSQSIVELDCGDTLQIRIEVPESNILSLREGAQAVVSFDALPGRTFPGQVREIGLAERELVTRFPVIIRLGEAPAGLRSGMSATVEVQLAEDQSVANLLLVPVKALMQEGGQIFVYLLQPHAIQERGVVKKQPLRTGRVIGDWIEALDGVTTGDRVVTAGLQSIYDGLEVKLLPDNGRGE